MLKKVVIIPIDNDADIDTDLLSSEERHIVQKLLCYKVIVGSLEQFRENTDRAFVKGWNNSGPVKRGELLVKIIRQMEKDVALRLEEQEEKE